MTKLNPHLFADISSNNGTFNALKYRHAGLRMIAIKATEGSSYRNPKWAWWTNKAHRAGLVVTHYHYAKFTEIHAGRAQAEHFCRTVLPHLHRTDRICIDTEDRTLWDHERMAAFVRWFAEVTHFHTGRGLVCYGSSSWFRGVGMLLPSITDEVWLAEWSDTAEWPAGAYTRWARQFTDGRMGPLPHSLPGIGNCDISVMSHALYERIIGK